MVMWVEQQKIRMLRIHETMDEFKAFTYDVTKTGKIDYSAPPGLHDDIVIAHCLAVHSLHDRIPKRGKPKVGRIRAERFRQERLNESEDQLEYVEDF